jgi:hypothetical protein
MNDSRLLKWLSRLQRGFPTTNPRDLLAALYRSRIIGRMYKIKKDTGLIA